MPVCELYGNSWRHRPCRERSLGVRVHPGVQVHLQFHITYLSE
jgi:hypothetical protein